MIPPAPRTVSAGSALLLAAAAAITFDSVVGLIHARAVTEAFQIAYAQVESAQFSIVSIRATAVVLLVVAGGLGLLAYLNLRGSPAARVNTWVLGALLLCWGGYSLIAPARPPSTVPDPAQLERLLDAAVPAWVEPATAISQMVVLVAMLGAMILLARPPARRHFAEPDLDLEPPPDLGSEPDLRSEPDLGSEPGPDPGSEVASTSRLEPVVTPRRAPATESPARPESHGGSKPHATM